MASRRAHCPPSLPVELITCVLYHLQPRHCYATRGVNKAAFLAAATSVAQHKAAMTLQSATRRLLVLLRWRDLRVSVVKQGSGTCGTQLGRVNFEDSGNLPLYDDNLPASTSHTAVIELPMKVSEVEVPNRTHSTLAFSTRALCVQGFAMPVFWEQPELGVDEVAQGADVDAYESKELLAHRCLTSIGVEIETPFGTQTFSWQNVQARDAAYQPLAPTCRTRVRLPLDVLQ